MMKPEEKIFLDRDEDLETVREYLKKAKAKRVILNIPRNAALGARVDNLLALKEESLVLNIELAIESVDEHILELAGLTQIQATNPVLRRPGRVVSDILPRVRKKQELELLRRDPETEEKEEEIAEEEQTLEEEAEVMAPPPKIQYYHRPRRLKPLLIFFSAGLVIAISGVLLTLFVLPRATITITVKKASIDFAETILVDAAALEPKLENEGKITVPGELLSATLNLEMEFPATGKEAVEQRAKGKLTIYNAFSSEPQILVAGTRFESPDKKIFRTPNRLIIPGAKSEGGKLIPSSIEADIVADKPGEEYNIAPAPHWRIPGFLGTPRYEKFYGVLQKPTSSGFAGRRAKPSEEELEQAKAKVYDTLKKSLEGQLALLRKEELKELDGATEFVVVKEEVGPGKSENAFSVFAEAEMKRLVFDERMVKDILAKKYRPQEASALTMKTFEVAYGTQTNELAKGKVSFPITGKMLFEAPVDVPTLTAELLELSEESLKRSLLKIPGLERARVSLWPFWVKKVPRRIENVKIILE